MWVKQCHKPCPSLHHEFRGGMVPPLPVMGGKMALLNPHILRLMPLEGVSHLDAVTIATRAMVDLHAVCGLPPPNAS